MIRRRAFLIGPHVDRRILRLGRLDAFDIIYVLGLELGGLDFAVFARPAFLGQVRENLGVCLLAAGVNGRARRVFGLGVVADTGLTLGFLVERPGAVRQNRKIIQDLAVVLVLVLFFFVGLGPLRFFSHFDPCLWRSSAGLRAWRR
ncbi:MAG: hypothetical protein EXQ86_07435 [Rhodospirillales bacterium]|nr:hypothetical protein [Rhodospirillales bacterium]